MSKRSAVAEVLRAFAAVAAESDAPWYLFGAQAAIVWGSARFSADVDVTVVLPRPRLTTFIDAMNVRGFVLVVSDAEFVERTRVLAFIHEPTRIPLDVVLAGPGLEDEFLSRAISVTIEGTSARVISPEDLIVTKILAGRAKDIEDVRGVISEQKATLDVARIRTMLEVLEAALSQGDLLPVFERQWQRFERSD